MGYREELRKRFARAETTLFRLRFDSDDNEERQEFLQSLNLDWTVVCTYTPHKLFTSRPAPLPSHIHRLQPDPKPTFQLSPPSPPNRYLPRKNPPSNPNSAPSTQRPTTPRRSTKSPGRSSPISSRNVESFSVKDSRMCPRRIRSV